MEPTGKTGRTSWTSCGRTDPRQNTFAMFLHGRKNKHHVLSTWQSLLLVFVRDGLQCTVLGRHFSDNVKITVVRKSGKLPVNYKLKQPNVYFLAQLLDSYVLKKLILKIFT